MTEGPKPYPVYKPSGMPWLGDVPEHWDVLPNRALFTEAKERDHPEEQMLSVTITKGVVRQQALLADSSKKDNSNLDKSAYKFVRPGDIAYNKMRAWQGAVGMSVYQGIVSPAYVVQRPREAANPRYYHYLLRTPAFAKEAERWSYGITSDMWSLRPEHFKMIYGCLPSLPEQSAIVRFLDHVDRRIRKHIRAKQKLIGLLNEQKQAIIHKAVTRGLDPNVKLKPSGVPWLGDVPEHWEVKRLKWVTRLQRGYDLPADKRVPGPYPVISSGGLIDTHSESRCLGPGVVMGRYGSTDAVFYVERDFWPHNTALFVTHFQGNMPRWCYYLLRTITKADLAGKSAVPGVDRKDLFQIVVAVPPIEEQAEIVRSIEKGSQNLNDAISAAQREIALLREYRTRLVADVVTGKVDVRTAAAGLPEEAGETESVDEIEADVDDTEDSVGEAEADDGEVGS
jgi:type I restriction enzyme, S subunit